MPDRCCLTMKFRLADEEKVKEVLGNSIQGVEWDDRRVHGSVVEIEKYDANYGWTESRDEMAADGVAFVGEHGAGEEYDPHAFVSDGTEMVEMPMDRDGCFAVPVSWSAEEQRVEMDEDRRNHAEVFFRMRERVERMLAGEGSGSEPSGREQAGNSATLNMEVQDHETANH